MFLSTVKWSVRVCLLTVDCMLLVFNQPCRVNVCVSPSSLLMTWFLRHSYNACLLLDSYMMIESSTVSCAMRNMQMHRSPQPLGGPQASALVSKYCGRMKYNLSIQNIYKISQIIFALLMFKETPIDHWEWLEETPLPELIAQLIRKCLGWLGCSII